MKFLVDGRCTAVPWDLIDVFQTRGTARTPLSFLRNRPVLWR